MSGRSSQRKGAQGERELAAYLAENGITTERGGFCFGEKPDLVGMPGIHVEVKRVEHLNVLEAMKQAAGDAEKFQDGLPCVFHRRNRSPWLVTMCLRDWLDLYRRWAE